MKTPQVQPKVSLFQDPATAVKVMLILVLVAQSTALGQGRGSALAQKITPKEAIGNPSGPSAGLTPLFSALSSDVVTGDANSDHPEISAVAIPRGGACGGGTVLKSRTSRLIISVGRDLNGTANVFALWSYLTQGLNPDPLSGGQASDLTPKLNEALSTDSKYFPGTDNQFVRTSNGDLIAARMSYIERSAAPYWNGISGGRVGLLTVRSKDCGATWEFNGFLDPAKITLKFNNQNFPGVGAYPQKIWTDTTKTSSQLVQGGGDRHEFYADPWDSQSVYATLWFGGNNDRTNSLAAVNPSQPPVFNALIFGSTDGGKTWGSEPIKMFDSNPIPLAMTTTRARRLFLFNCVNSTPTLHYVKDGKYIQSWPVFHGDARNPENACAADLRTQAETAQLTAPGYLSRVIQDVSISRVEGSGVRDTVRVVYPAVRAGRRIAHVVVVRIQESAKLDVDQFGNPKKTGTMLAMSKLHEETLVAESPTGNIIYPTFIETDRVDLPKNSTTNTAVLYWYETGNVPVNPGKPAVVGLFTRYSVFRDGGPVPGGAGSPAQDLSVTKGARRYWSPLNNEFVGDYMRGAFIFDGKLRFIAQWPERDSGKHLRIRYNIVSVEP
ncbi:MAG: hypothetical protein ABIP75_03870 [Pyrinomonadaceae bacterium]